MDIENQKSTTVPVETDSRWLHMDKVEYEKLEWMKDLPTPSAQRAPDDSVRYRVVSIAEQSLSFRIQMECQLDLISKAI